MGEEEILQNTDIRQQVRDLPDSPGVYKYYDVDDRLLYIGKAKNLKKRVSSYFVNKLDQGYRIKVMISKIRRIEYAVVASEYDALLLENNLIKSYQPRYNVSLRDDKTYPFLAIKNEPFPRVFPTRNRIDDGSEYYGPYANVGAMKVMLELIRKLLPTRSCSFALTPENIEAGKFKVCLDYHIKLCKGPCEGLMSAQDYDENIENIRHILKGNTREVERYMQQRLGTLVEQLNFEEAKVLKDKLDLLAKFQARSTIVNPNIKMVDVFSIVSNENLAFVNYLRVINGAVITTDTIEVRKKLDEPDEEILLLALANIREKHDSRAKEIIVPFSMDMEGEKLIFTVPKLGDKKKLLELSQKNAFYYFQDRIRSQELNKDKRRNVELLTQMKQDLNLKEIPYHIECFDNSNLQGTAPVSAIVVFRNGSPSKKEYRHFNVKTVEQINDVATMEEAVYRRYRRMLEELQPLPQLIIIDGGKGQLNAAVKSLHKLNIADKVDIIGIAKRLEEIYKPGDPIPLSINKKSPTLKLIQRARDEAHNHGVSKHRKKRISINLVSQLEDIPGIGKKTAEKLLSHFKSVKKLREASELELIKLVGQAKAKQVMETLSQI